MLKNLLSERRPTAKADRKGRQFGGVTGLTGLTGLMYNVGKSLVL